MTDYEELLEKLYFLRDDKHLTIQNETILNTIQFIIQKEGYYTSLNYIKNRLMIKQSIKEDFGYQIIIYDDILETYKNLREVDYTKWKYLKDLCKDNLTTKVISVSPLCHIHRTTEEQARIHTLIFQIIDSEYDFIIGEASWL